jgi:hypothetical protein
MHKLGMTALLTLALIMGACGSNGSGSGSGNINGSWNASLTDANGSPAFAFVTTFTQSSGASLSVTSFSFTSDSPCFSSGQTSETGSFGFTGDFNGNVNGTFAMTITTVFPGTTNNVLTLNGTVAGKKITGTWTLTGQSGCSGNGNFTITALLPA